MENHPEFLSPEHLVWQLQELGGNRHRMEEYLQTRCGDLRHVTQGDVDALAALREQRNLNAPSQEKAPRLRLSLRQMMGSLLHHN